MALRSLDMRDIIVDTLCGNVLPTGALVGQVSRIRFQNHGLQGVRMPEVAGISLTPIHVLYKVPVEKFSLTQITPKFGAVPLPELFTMHRASEGETTMKSRKARRITVAFDMVRLSSEKLRTKRPGRTGFHRLEYARILRTVAVVLLAMLTSISAAWGQATTSLRGTVTDRSGKAVAGARVVLSRAETKTARNVTTGDQGEYQFLLVPPGTYTLTVTATGFRRYEQKDLALLVNTPATANVQLKIGATAEVVTVTSEAPAINMVDASLGNSFEEKQVIQLPLEGRNVPVLLSLQAGVAYTGNRIGDKDQDTRNGAVNGAGSDQSNITLVAWARAY